MQQILRADIDLFYSAFATRALSSIPSTANWPTGGRKKTYTVTGLKPGNYHLVGLELPDPPKPGNTRTHQFMIYAGLETVYDVCYLTNNKLAIN